MRDKFLHGRPRKLTRDLLALANLTFLLSLFLFLAYYAPPKGI